MKKKIIAGIATIISLLTLSVNTFALSTDNTLSKTSYRSWSNISGIEILYDNYSTTLDYTGEIEEDAPDSYNEQLIVTNNVIVAPMVEFIEIPNAGELVNGTHYIDFPTFRNARSDDLYNRLEVYVRNDHVISITYLNTEAANMTYTAFAYPAWNGANEIGIESRRIYMDGGRAAWTFENQSTWAGDYTFMYNNTTKTSFLDVRARKHVGNLAVNSTDGDYMNFTQSFTMQKKWGVGYGSPIIFSFQSKNAAFYPDDIEYDGASEFDSILPTFQYAGYQQDNIDESQPIPTGWAMGEYAKTDIEYTYYLKQKSANGEYYVTQYSGSKTIFQYPNMSDGENLTTYYILPHPSMIFSEEIYESLVGIIYENTTTRIYTSRALNNYDFSYTDTLMRDNALNDRSISVFMENMRFNPIEELHFSDLSIFLTSITDGFFNTDIFGLFSVSDILFVVIGISLLIVFLKMFAGG